MWIDENLCETMNRISSTFCLITEMFADVWTIIYFCISIFLTAFEYKIMENFIRTTTSMPSINWSSMFSKIYRSIISHFEGNLHFTDLTYFQHGFSNCSRVNVELPISKCYLCCPSSFILLWMEFPLTNKQQPYFHLFTFIRVSWLFWILRADLSAIQFISLSRGVKRSQ